MRRRPRATTRACMPCRCAIRRFWSPGSAGRYIRSKRVPPAAGGTMREAVFLSTCNRAELYGVCDDVEHGRAAAVDFIAEFHSVDRQSLQPHLYQLADVDVARHLFRVAAGLDSLVVGEPQ